MLRWRVAAVTDRGCHRKTNEDNFFVSQDKRVFAVADGAGGSPLGAQASAITVAEIESLWHERAPSSTDIAEVKNWMIEAISRANKSVWLANQEHNARRRGSTVVLAIPLSEGRIAISHVGDSRAYRIRDKCAELLTLDHTVVNEMIRAGQLTAEQARYSCRNFLTRSIGHVETVSVELSDFQLEPKDNILLCTDGLSCVLPDEDIAVNGRMGDPAVACENLLRATIDGGAPDNVTMIVICFEAEQINDECSTAG